MPENSGVGAWWLRVAESSPPLRDPGPPRSGVPGQFGAEVPGSGPIWRWGPKASKVPAVSVFSSACGVSTPFFLLACRCAALAIGLSPLEKGLKRGSRGLAPCHGPFGRAGKRASKGLAKGLAICPSFWVYK